MNRSRPTLPDSAGALTQAAHRCLPYPHQTPYRTYRRPCASSCRIFSSTACSAAARHALVSSSFCRALSPGEAPSDADAAGGPGAAAAAAAAAARGGLAGTCSPGVPGDGGLAGLALSEGGVLAGLARAEGGWRAGEGVGDGLALPDCSPAAALTGLGAVGGGGGLGDTGGGVPWAPFTSAGRRKLAPLREVALCESWPSLHEPYRRTLPHARERRCGAQNYRQVPTAALRCPSMGRDSPCKLGRITASRSLPVLP